MDQENSNCKELILQSDLPQEQKDNYIRLLDGRGRVQIHGNQISMIEYTTIKEKLAILNKFNKYKTFDKTFSKFEITSIRDKQNNQDLVIVIQLNSFNGIDEIKKYLMEQRDSIQAQITSIKQKFNQIFSSYIEFRDQFKNDELKNFCIHKILSLTLGEFRISVIDNKCDECTRQTIKTIQIQLIQQLAAAFNEIKRREYQQEQQPVVQELEEQWKIDDLKQQITQFQINNQNELLYEGFVKSELIPSEIPKFQQFVLDLKDKFVQSPFILKDRIHQQLQQFNQEDMINFRNVILSNKNNYPFTDINMEIYNMQYLVYFLIIQKIILKDQTVEQRERNLLKCLRPYLQLTQYKDGLYNFCKSFQNSTDVLDQIIKKLDELQ